MAIQMGLDIHREQMTYELLDTDTGELRGGRLARRHGRLGTGCWPSSERPRSRSPSRPPPAGALSSSSWRRPAWGPTWPCPQSHLTPDAPYRRSSWPETGPARLAQRARLTNPVGIDSVAGGDRRSPSGDQWEVGMRGLKETTRSMSGSKPAAPVATTGASAYARGGYGSGIHDPRQVGLNAP
jgi:hypothetical protein